MQEVRSRGLINTKIKQ